MILGQPLTDMQVDAQNPAKGLIDKSVGVGSISIFTQGALPFKFSQFFCILVGFLKSKKAFRIQFLVAL